MAAKTEEDNEDDRRSVTPEDEERIKRALTVLAEHFDSVHIFVTKHDPVNDRTESFSNGTGNVYANYGAIMRWVDRWGGSSSDEE